MLTWAASRFSAVSTCSGWIAPGKKGQLRRALFDEATEPTVEDDSVLGTNVRLETGVIEVLLENKELRRVVAFGVDAELDISRLLAYLLGEVGDERLNRDSEPGFAVNSAYRITGTSDFISRCTVCLTRHGPPGKHGRSEGEPGERQDTAWRRDRAEA